MDVTIEYMQKKAVLPESDMISSEFRTRVRLEADLKDRKETLELIEKENQEAIEKMMLIRDEINKEREGHENLKKEIVEVRNSPQPDIKQLEMSLQGYLQYQRSENEKIKLLKIQEDFLNQQIAEHTSQTSPTIVWSLNNEIEDMREKIGEKKQRFQVFLRGKERNWRVTNKKELNNLENDVQSVIVSLENLGRRERNAQLNIEQSKEVLHHYHITISI